MYNKIVVGIDQSYKNTGIAIAADSRLIKVSSINLEKIKTNTEKRNKIRKELKKIIESNINKAKEFMIITERIRTFSAGFISTNYIKSTGALLGVIVDLCFQYNLKVFSVDTRSWKSKILGSSKSKSKSKKQTAIDFITKKGFNLYIRKNRNGKKIYNDDAADAACIALYGFLEKTQQKINVEK